MHPRELIPTNGFGATILFSAVGACGALLGIIYGLAWVKHRGERANLMFLGAGLSLTVMAGLELAMAHAASPAEYAPLQRWYHVAVWVCLVCFIGFARSYVGRTRDWLAALAIVLRGTVLVPNFFSGAASQNFLVITELARVRLLGEEVSVPVGVPNPWMAVAQLSLLLIAVYFYDNAVTAYRERKPPRVAAVGVALGSMCLLGVLQAILVYWGFARVPVTGSLFFLGVIGVMGYALSREVISATAAAFELQRQRALIDAVFDGVPGLLYLYTRDGRLRLWNRRHETLTGLSAQELAGKRAEDWFRSEDLPRLRRAWEEVFQLGESSLEADLVIKGARTIPCFMTGVGLEIDGEQYMLGVGLDISEQRRMQAELQGQRRELAHGNRVSSLGILAASIAHELTQPLTAILSNAQAGQRFLTAPNPDLGEVRDILKDIASEGVRAADVIRGMRALLKKEAPRSEILDLNRLVDTVASLVQGESTFRNVPIQKSLTDGLPQVSGDRTQLQQVLLNLLINALDACAPGEGRVEVLTEVAGDASRILVRDNGVGIPPEKLASVFEPFTTTKGAGLGVGLSICRSIVDAHGGRIWAENDAGGGTTFTVELPVPGASGGVA